ncbi:hypothetical protein AAG906_010763 [Vitis piasezkii]
MSRANSIILELGPILLSWRCIGLKEGSPLRSPVQDVRGFSLGLISNRSPSLFQEKVHKRSLRADTIPSSFQGCYAKFGALGVSFEPQLSASAFARASHDTYRGYNCCSRHSRAPPAAPASSQPSTSAEPRMAIPISEYRELCRSLETLTASQSSLAQEMAAIRACQEQMLATQAQHTAILRQLQLHFDLPPAVEPSTSTPKSLKPHQEVPLPPFNYNHSYHIEDNARFGWGNEEGSMLSLLVMQLFW